MPSTRKLTSAAFLSRRPSYNKFRNKKTEVDGITFHSLKESRRYSELKLLARAGQISDLELQVKFSLDVNGHHVCNYFADFCYTENGKPVVEDSKGVKTKDYILKRKLMLALYNIKILET